MRLDSPVLAAGTRITNLLILNFYWLLGCLPIVTAGASTIAAFSVTLKMAEDREGSSMPAQLWTAFVKNLKHGVPLSLILLAGLGSVWMDVKLIEEQIGDSTSLLIAGIAVLILLLMHFLYVFALEARYKNGLLAGLSNARGIFLYDLRRSLLLTAALLAEFILITQLNTPLRLFSILFLPILMIYTISKALMPVLRNLEETAGKQNPS